MLVQSQAANAAADQRTARITAAADFRSIYPYVEPRDFLNYIYKAVPQSGDPQKVQQAMDAFAEVYPMYAVGGKKATVLERVLRECNAKQCLEIGSFFGYSAISIAKTLAPDARLTCLEGNPENIAVMRAVLRHAFGNGAVLDRITIIEGLSTASLLAMKPNPAQPFDFVFLDHDKDCYLKDLAILEEKGLLDKEGPCTLVADNVVFPGAPGFLEYLDDNASRWTTTIEKLPFERVGFETQWKEREDGMSISLRRGNTRS